MKQKYKSLDEFNYVINICSIYKNLDTIKMIKFRGFLTYLVNSKFMPDS